MTWTVYGVPIDCVGADAPDSPLFGTESAPAELRRAGLLEALEAHDGGDVAVRLIGATRDAQTGLVGGHSVAEVTRSVRTLVADTVTHGIRPLLVGGCCTFVPGAIAGVRDATGGGGLVYLDGHLDMYTELTSTTGEAADMPVAVLLGHGPSSWLDSLGSSPLLTRDALVVAGHRDDDEARSLGSLLPADLPGLWAPDADEVRRDPAAAGRAAAATATGAGRVWLHLDVDVMDESAFPATDYLMPGGLTVHDVAEFMAGVARTVDLVGASVACYNPEKDIEGRYAADVVRLLTTLL